MNFIALDVETANPNFASICQIGIVTFRNGVVVDTWQTLINPNDYFDPYNSHIHGLSESDCSRAPKYEEIYPAIREKISDNIVVHHSSFDKSSISRACAKHNLELFNCRWLDTVKVSRVTWPELVELGGYKLNIVARMLGINFIHHKANEDARVAGQILVHATSLQKCNISDWFDKFEQKSPVNSNSYIKPDTKRKGNPDGELFGDTIVFTGELNSLTRVQAANFASDLGCDVADSVTKKTTLLVVGDQDIRVLAGHNKSTKHRKAEEYIAKGQRIRIFAESEFLKLVKIS